MANHREFNKIVRRLKGRQWFCKTFYDNYWIQNKLGKNEVYLKEEVDNNLKELRELFDNQEDEIIKQKKKADDLQLENYQLKIEFKRKKELKQKLK